MSKTQFRIAIAGRPNVGKSTLFNRLVGRKLAIVHNTPGVTRDWQEARGELFGLNFNIIDTAGLDDHAPRGDLGQRMTAHSWQAITMADLVLFVVDGTTGVVAEDLKIAQALRKSGKPILLLINKCDRKDSEPSAEFYRFGFAATIPISAAHGEGMDALAEYMREYIPGADSEENTPAPGERPIKIVVVGKPNAGKSTLINRILGQERLLTGPEAGITRDAIAIPFSSRGRDYELVDTAGLRKKAKVQETLEQMATGDTIQALNFADVVLVMLDVSQGVTHQDLTIAALAANEGRAVVLVINKWDLTVTKQETKKSIVQIVEKSMPQMKGLPVIYISAKENSGMDSVFKAINSVYTAWNKRISTGKLNNWLRKTVESYPPPMVNRRRLKLRYATQIKTRPPTIVMFVNDSYNMPQTYEKYLVNRMRDEFGLAGVPIRLYLRQGENPYDEKD
jgi:GTP-binding protein